MVSGDTPERPVIDSIIKVRWQTHVIRVCLCLGGGGGVHVLTKRKAPSLRGLDRIGINVEAFAVYDLILLSLGATQEWLHIFSSFNSASCWCMAILYRTTKFRSTNIIARMTLGPISKFNFRQCFWVCGVIFSSKKVRWGWSAISCQKTWCSTNLRKCTPTDLEKGN